MQNLNVTHDELLLRPITWSAVFAGTIAAIIVGSMFNLFGIGLGLSAFTLNAQGALTIGTAGIVWLIVSTIIYSFVCGWMAGWLGNKDNIFITIIHGCLAWALATMFTILVISTTAGTMISSSTQVLTTALSSTNQNIANLTSIAKPNTSSGDQNQLDGIKQSVNQRESQQNIQDTNKEQQQRQMVEKAAKSVGKAALATFFILLLGIFSAAIGSTLGVRKNPD